MATMASKGPDEPDEDEEVVREVRSVVEEPRRSPAEREFPPPEEDWTWEAAKSLEEAAGGQLAEP